MILLYDNTTKTQFKFDEDTWIVMQNIGSDESGYWPSSLEEEFVGDITIYKSPRARKDGKFRYVLTGKRCHYTTQSYNYTYRAEYVGTSTPYDAPIEED